MVQLPRLSTAVSLRTITLRFDIRLVAMERATVKATGNPSGIAETARATTKKKIAAKSIPFMRKIIAKKILNATTA